MIIDYCCSLVCGMITIRNAIENDLPEILEIYNDIILNTTAVYDYKPHTMEMRKQWFNAKKEQGFPVFVAEENGKVVGLSSIGPFRPGLHINTQWRIRFM